MKNKVKKIMCLIMCVLMIFSIGAVNSFAYIDDISKILLESGFSVLREDGLNCVYDFYKSNPNKYLQLENGLLNVDESNYNNIEHSYVYSKKEKASYYKNMDGKYSPSAKTRFEEHYSSAINLYKNNKELEAFNELGKAMRYMLDVLIPVKISIGEMSQKGKGINSVFNNKCHYIKQITFKNDLSGEKMAITEKSFETEKSFGKEFVKGGTLEEKLVLEKYTIDRIIDYFTGPKRNLRPEFHGREKSKGECFHRRNMIKRYNDICKNIGIASKSYNVHEVRGFMSEEEFRACIDLPYLLKLCQKLEKACCLKEEIDKKELVFEEVKGIPNTNFYDLRIDLSKILRDTENIQNDSDIKKKEEHLRMGQDKLSILLNQFYRDVNSEYVDYLKDGTKCYIADCDKTKYLDSSDESKIRLKSNTGKKEQRFILKLNDDGSYCFIVDKILNSNETKVETDSDSDEILVVKNKKIAPRITKNSKVVNRRTNALKSINVDKALTVVEKGDITLTNYTGDVSQRFRVVRYNNKYRLVSGTFKYEKVLSAGIFDGVSVKDFFPGDEKQIFSIVPIK